MGGSAGGKRGSTGGGSKWQNLLRRGCVLLPCFSARAGHVERKRG